MLSDMNGRQGDIQISSLVGNWGTNGVNKNGECLATMCVEGGLVLVNPFLWHKIIHNYTWRGRVGREEQKSLTLYSSR